MECSFCNLEHRFKKRLSPLFFSIFLVFFLASWNHPTFANSLPVVLSILSKPPENLEEIETLVRFRWYDEALKALEFYPQDDEKVLELKARSFVGKKQYESALSLYTTLNEKVQNPSLRRLVLLGEAKTLSRLKRYKESISIYEHLFESTNKQKDKHRWRWMAFKTALEGKLYFDGLRFLQGLKDEKALWWRGWCHFQQGELQEALRHWEKILPRRLGKAYYPKVLYWKAHIFEQQKDNAKSQELLHRLMEEYSGNFYSFLALIKTYPEKEQKEALQKFWTEFPKEEGPVRVAWEGRFPKSFNSFILDGTKKNRIDPYLVFALIRQESFFREDALSTEGAMGLMQLLPQTALQLAKVSHLKNFEVTDIFDPKTNIRLGCLYLKFLNKLFDADLPSIIASYNAGEEAVSRWLAVRGKEHPLFFIEEIPYEETQNYTQKVLTHYWIYRLLYEGELPDSNLSTPSKTAMR